MISQTNRLAPSREIDTCDKCQFHMYRQYGDEPFCEKLPDLLEKDATYQNLGCIPNECPLPKVHLVLSGEASCLNCNHALWQMTNHNPPRINKNCVGKCYCPTEKFVVKIPEANIHEYGYRAPRTMVNIFPDHPYTNCDMWEPKS